MARNENPPFPRGQTFYSGGTIDTNALGGVQLEGMEWVFEDVDPRQGTSGASTRRTNRPVKCRLVRNDGTLTLLPKRLVQPGVTAGKVKAAAEGYPTATAGKVQGVVDEYLPSTGIPPNDIGWIVIGGPTLVLTDLAGGANNVINVDDYLVALAGATSGATTAGRVVTQDLTGATALLGNNVQNVIGVAMSAATTANTNAGILADIGSFL